MSRAEEPARHADVRSDDPPVGQPDESTTIAARDPSESPGPTGAAIGRAPAKRARAWRVVAVLLVLLVALLAVGAAIYFTTLHYRPTAHRHVPANTALAVRAEAAAIVLFKPVRKHLWPLLTERDGEPSREPSDDKGGRLARIAELTGIHIPRDLREVVVASVDATSWVVLVGGKLRRGDFVSGIEQLLREEGVGGWHRDDELLVHLLGPAIAQADDGTLVFGTSSSIVRAALPEGQAEAHLPVPVEGALSFHASAPLWSGAASLLPASLPGLGTLSRIEDASGSLTLTDEPLVRLTLRPKAGVEATTLRGEVEQLLTGARLLTLLTSEELGGAKEALRSAKVDASAAAVEITAPWPYEPLDRAVERLANRLRGKPEPAAAPTRPWSLF